MKKLVLFLILACSILYVSAEELIDGSPIRFSLLKALDYQLNLTTGTSIGRLYVGVEYLVNKNELLNTDYYSFFLNQNAYLEKVQLNGVETRYNVTTNLHPKHFIPELPQPELLDGSLPVNCYSFDAAIFENLPEQIRVSLEYWLPLPAYQTGLDGRESISLGTLPFFYPRNLSESSQINVNLITTFTHGVDTAINTSDTGGIRNIQARIVDIPKEEINFYIHKLN